MDQDIISGTPGRYWHRLDDGRIQCDLCPRLCKLHEGQRGLCFVRARQGDRIVLTTYGRSSGFCIDPIEKKPLNHFLPGTAVLSFGTAGCNLTCKFCQNWDISKARAFDRLQEEASPEAIADAAVASGCRSVAFTYNDPVIFLEYAIDTAIACRARGIKTVAVSAGYICAEPRVEFFRHMDAANIDLKGFTERFYRNLCSAQLGPVLETLQYLKHETDVWLEITTLLIPGENDSQSEIEALSAWVMEHLGPDVPLHFTAFHPDWKMLDKPPTPLATLRAARTTGRATGLRHVYVGNVHDPAGDSTYCHTCGVMLIGRDWHALTAWNLTDDGRCVDCGTACPGVFHGPPGGWGRRRRTVPAPRALSS
jgi:pyruvate formate lyase activating enzyme